MSFGSPLAVPATRNTAENLNYAGTDTPLPGRVVHTYHYGADTALWNPTLLAGTSAAPADGQILKVSLEGCAKPALGGPPPLTEIHFQALVPLPGGGARVAVTSQGFQIPVCGQTGASGSTVTTYEPTNLCVNAGDYVDLNDEGGFVEGYYQSGVPYLVVGSVSGSTMDSFIKGGGTGNGATLSPSEKSSMDGFASNQNEELMLQALLGTGPDATPLCPGGTRGEARSSSISISRKAATPTTPISIGKQSDGVNHSRIVAVAVYCRQSVPCTGVLTLQDLRKGTKYGKASFDIPAKKTSHVRMRVPSKVLKFLRKHRRGMEVKLTGVVGSDTVTQDIRLLL